MILGSPSKIRLQRKNGSRGKMTGGWPDDNDHDDHDCVDNDHVDNDYDDVMVTLLRFALLFLIFSRELETDFGGNMFSRLLAYPGSDNKPLPLLLSLLPKLPTSLTWLRQLTVETWRS